MELLCKKDKLLMRPNVGSYDLVTVLKRGEYYNITYPVDRLVCVRYGTGKHDIMLFHRSRDAYGYDSIWNYFYTVKEERRIKLKRLELL